MGLGLNPVKTISVSSSYKTKQLDAVSTFIHLAADDASLLVKTKQGNIP